MTGSLWREFTADRWFPSQSRNRLLLKISSGEFHGSDSRTAYGFYQCSNVRNVYNINVVSQGLSNTFSPWISRYKCSISIRHRITEWPTCNLQGYSIAKVSICNAMVLMSRPCNDSEFYVLFARKCRGKKTVWLVLPLAMALMCRHFNGNAVYNLSHEIRNYSFNMKYIKIMWWRALATE